MNPELQPLEYNITLAKCDSTFGSVLNMMLEDFPSVRESVQCSSNNCELRKKSALSLVYFTYETTDGKVNDIQQLLDNRQYSDMSVCGRILRDSEEMCEGIK